MAVEVRAPNDVSGIAVTRRSSAPLPDMPLPSLSVQHGFRVAVLAIRQPVEKGHHLSEGGTFDQVGGGGSSRMGDALLVRLIPVELMEQTVDQEELFLGGGCPEEAVHEIAKQPGRCAAKQ